jgi:hypothetical protein
LMVSALKTTVFQSMAALPGIMPNKAILPP